MHCEAEGKRRADKLPQMMWIPVKLLANVTSDM